MMGPGGGDKDQDVVCGFGRGKERGCGRRLSTWQRLYMVPEALSPGV